MPLPDSPARREIHQRAIDMKAYAREDGLYDIEAHLVDRKPYTFKRFSSPEPLPAGQPLHDLRVRLTVDDQFVVRHVHASSDVTPYGVCKEAESTLAVLVGERIASGWSKRVKELLRGAVSCTHLMEMLIPMATTAFQGILSLDSEKNIGSVDANGVPNKLDSCYAFSRNREVVMRLWPQHYAPRETSIGET
jgi:hypothetical protein